MYPYFEDPETGVLCRRLEYRDGRFMPSQEVRYVHLPKDEQIVP